MQTAYAEEQFIKINGFAEKGVLGVVTLMVDKGANLKELTSQQIHWSDQAKVSENGAFSVYLPNPSTARLKIPPHITEVQRPTSTSNIALIGTFTNPNKPSALFLNTGIFTIVSVEDKMAPNTNAMPIAETVVSIAFADTLAPTAAPTRRPMSIKNQ